MCSSRGELLQSVPLFHNPSVFSIIRLPVPPWRSFKFGCCEEMQKVHLQFSLGGPNVRYFHFLKGTWGDQNNLCLVIGRFNHGQSDTWRSTWSNMWIVPTGKQLAKWKVVVHTHTRGQRSSRIFASKVVMWPGSTSLLLWGRSLFLKFSWHGRGPLVPMNKKTVCQCLCCPCHTMVTSFGITPCCICSNNFRALSLQLYPRWEQSMSSRFSEVLCQRLSVDLPNSGICHT